MRDKAASNYVNLAQPDVHHHLRAQGLHSDIKAITFLPIDSFRNIGVDPMPATTVVENFADRKQTDAAVTDLISKGFRSGSIGLAMQQGLSISEDVSNDPSTDTTAGAVTVALTGLVLGAFIGIGVVSGFVPAVGPAIAAGTLGVILSDAAAGAGLVGLIGPLVGSGFSQEEARYYQSAFESEHVIVHVYDKTRSAQAAATMHTY